MDIFWNHTIQIALIQYSGQLKHVWAFSETAKKFPKSPVWPAGCELWSVYHVYFWFSGFITRVCTVLKKSLNFKESP